MCKIRRHKSDAQGTVLRRSRNHHRERHRESHGLKQIRQQSRQRNKKATSAVKEQRTRGQSERRQTQRAQRAADSQQQTVTITTTLIRSYYTLMTILYFTIQCYATYVLSLYYLYFTCTTCTLFVLLRTDPGPRHFLLRPPPLP